MFNLRREYQTDKGLTVTIDDRIIFINNKTDLLFDDFQLLIREGYGFLFDLSNTKKTCKVCGEKKKESQFYILKSRLMKTCKICHKEKMNTYYQENKSK